ncbi:MAG TPA: glycine cleavage system protein GcvH [Methylophilaceae bacterium]|jgi:glycine cleavage system H protein|nr:glycine cleavage system protein GcvH [Methylophilaceae bacterium]HBO18434.1 glycine cleavage system protein GcvH [Methylophilaceae bacterium]HCB68300.1 glycine cleavage system protein GcvH [Methylophilaceae bacterium]
MSTPNTLIYTPEHLWIKPIGENIYEIGITDYAQNLLGDIVFVELPVLQSQISKNIAFGVVESVKTASDLIGPLNGEVIEINPNIQKSPELINDKPYENWICKISSQDDMENKELFLDASRYDELTR